MIRREVVTTTITRGILITIPKKLPKKMAISKKVLKSSLLRLLSERDQLT